MGPAVSLLARSLRWLAAVALVVAAGLLGGGSTPAAALVETCYPPTSLCGIIENPWIIADLNGTTGSATAIVGAGTVTAVGVATGVKVAQDNGAFDGSVSVTDSGVSPWTLTPDGAELPDATGTGGPINTSYLGVSVAASPTSGFPLSQTQDITIAWTYSAWAVARYGEVRYWCRIGGTGTLSYRTVLWTSLGTSAGGPFNPGGGFGGCQASRGQMVGYDIWVGTQANFGTDKQRIRTAGEAADPVSDASRWIEQTVTCRRPNGTTYDRSGTVPVVSWSGTTPITVTGIDCDPGDVALDWAADVVGSGTGDRTRVGEAHAADSVRSASNACLTGAANCKAVLEQLQADGTTWLSCHVSGTNCVGWWQSQNRAQTYRCRYGNDTEGWITVALSVCSIYRDAAPGGSLKPATDTSTSSQPGATDGSCDLGWGDLLNGTIVQKAVGCALTWAFVPDPAVVTELQAEAASAWSTSDTGLFWSGLIGVFAPLGDLGGGEESCGGLSFDLPLAGLHVDGTLFNTCVEPWSTYAPWVKGFLTCFVIVDGAWYLMRIVGAGLGWYVPAKSTAPEQMTLF